MRVRSKIHRQIHQREFSSTLAGIESGGSMVVSCDDHIMDNLKRDRATNDTECQDQAVPMAVETCSPKSPGELLVASLSD